MLLQQRVGKEMEVVMAVAAELHAQVFGPVEGEADGVLIRLRKLYSPRLRPYHHGQRIGGDDVGAQQAHAHLRLPVHIPLSERGGRQLMHVHLTGIHRHRLPVVPRLSDVDRIHIALGNALTGIK